MYRDRLNIPAVVRRRLESHELDLEAIIESGFATSLTRNGQAIVLEQRRTERIEQRLETREDGTTIWGVRGYASVVEIPYEVFGGKASGYGWDETIDRHAFDVALAEGDDVRFLLNHEGVAMARTKAGTLTLAADDIGLYSEAPNLDVTRSDVYIMRSAIERDELSEMSFAFRVTQQQWNGDYDERRILEVRLYDVAAVTFPANPATVIVGTGTRSVNMTVSLAREIAEATRLARKS